MSTTCKIAERRLEIAHSVTALTPFDADLVKRIERERGLKKYKL